MKLATMTKILGEKGDGGDDGDDDAKKPPHVI